jgi:hypothetical protein
MSNHLFVDLQMLTERLASSAATRPVLRKLRGASLAQSCTADLAQAQTCLDLITSLPALIGSAAGAERVAIEGALTMSASELYNRATSGNSGRGERGSIAIHEKLTPGQLEDHEAISRVRNRAMAHVYADEPLADDISWHSEFAFAVATKEGWRPGIASNRVQVSPVTVARLRRQVPVARELMMEIFRSRMSVLTDFLNSIDMDPGLWSECIFDAERRFGSAVAVAGILGAMDQGVGHFYTTS